MSVERLWHDGCLDRMGSMPETRVGSLGVAWQRTEWRGVEEMHCHQARSGSSHRYTEAYMCVYTVVGRI